MCAISETFSKTKTAKKSRKGTTTEEISTSRFRGVSRLIRRFFLARQEHDTTGFLPFIETRSVGSYGTERNRFGTVSVNEKWATDRQTVGRAPRRRTPFPPPSSVCVCLWPFTEIDWRPCVGCECVVWHLCNCTFCLVSINMACVSKIERMCVFFGSL